MWSERHKYHPHFAVVTSPSAIDSSNKCLEGAICACIECQADALEFHFEKCICVVGAGLKNKAENKRFYSQPDCCKLVKLSSNNLHDLCMSVWEVHFCNSSSGRAPQSSRTYVCWRRSSGPAWLLCEKCRWWLTGQRNELLITDWSMFMLSYWAQRSVQMPWFPASFIYN